MKKLIASAAILAFALNPLAATAEDDDEAMDGRSQHPITLAVFGDWPYSTILLNSAQLLIDSINSDSKVGLVLHVGDIHSGSMPCTGAGVNPPPAGSAPGWNQGIFDLFERFRDPLVYTPGDNEWTDCHKKKQSGSGAPLNELAAVRSVFFPNPGTTLGVQRRRVLTQAKKFSRVYPVDAQFVENVMWQESRVVFVTVNMPGSNNDGLAWTAPFTDETARTREAAQRTGAAIRWLQAAFASAEEDDARAVLIGLHSLRARCVMTTFDPDTLEQDVSVLKRIHREFDGRLALNAFVVRDGPVSVGDQVELLEADTPPGMRA